MLLPKLCIVTLTLLGTSACKTLETPPTADSACLIFRPIRYAVPPVQPDGTRNAAKDDDNQLDTVETVDQARTHNARLAAVCEPAR